MAQNKIELVITADDAKAAAAFTKLIEKTREAGKEADATGKKGQGSFEKWAGGIAGMVGPLASVSGAVKVAMELFDHLKEKIDAIREAQAKAAEVSKSYGESIRQYISNFPGISDDQVKSVDKFIRSTASSRSLGEGGLNKLAIAYAQIQSAIPGAPEEKKREALQETAKLLELVPTENATGVGLGIAKIMEASNWTLNGPQALNLLRQQQTLGLVKDVGPIAKGIPGLAAATFMASERDPVTNKIIGKEATFPEMQALAAYMTQKMGDDAGPESFNAISGMVSKIMTRGAKISDKLGGETEITGNLFERLQKISDAYKAGTLDEEAIGKLLPDLTRSEKGKMTVMGLIGGGLDELNWFRGQMTNEQVLKGDLTQQDITTLERALPTEGAQAQRRGMQSRGEARKAGDEESALAILLREEFEAKLNRERVTQTYRKSALEAFDMYSVYTPDIAPSRMEGMARASGMFSEFMGVIPYVGPAVDKTIRPLDLITAKNTESYYRQQGVTADEMKEAIKAGMRESSEIIARFGDKPRTPLQPGGLNR